MENKFREFIIAGTYMSVTLQDGGLQKFFVACSKIENTLITGDHVHTIEIAAVEQLKAELKESNDSWQRERLSAASYQVIDDLNSEITALKSENERLNKLAEGILAREESISAEYKLRIEIESENEALKSKLKIAVEALVLLESFGYITQFKYIKQALTEIGGEI